MKHLWFVILSLAVIAGVTLLYFFMIHPSRGISRSKNLLLWLRSPEAHTEWALTANETCGAAPFSLPTSGFIGYLWDDSFRPGHRHQGIDIFGGAEPGVTPVFAAADGYLTRLADWKSSVIMRIPSDPLHQGSQIWLYYTHMAYESGESLISAEYPPGSSEVFIKAGSLLGYQGNYSGTPGNPTGVHLHFSIVKDDGRGKFMNELEIGNTLDPSPYLGMALNGRDGGTTPVVCSP